MEQSFQQNRPRALVQMATGSGKTYMAVSSVFRLITLGGVRQVLFLGDRSDLGRQTLKEFEQYIIPDDGRPDLDPNWRGRRYLDICHPRK